MIITDPLDRHALRAPYARETFRFARAGIAVLALLVTSSASGQTTIQNVTYTPGQNVTVQDSEITAGPNVVVSGGAMIKFRASTKISLKPPFTASANSLFRAFVFIDSDGDGMDDAWENTYGLDPNNSADAALDADNDGVTNLAEYLLGTQPNAPKQTDTDNTATKLNVHRPPH
ncbi:MAG: thrombospondin type 3 repeat-containing protein [Opitutaceae bacterium]